MASQPWNKYALRLSSRAQRRICFFVFSQLFFSASPFMSTAAQSSSVRPKILGISGVQIVDRDPATALKFYSEVANVDAECHWCEASGPYPARVPLPSTQIIEIISGGKTAQSNCVDQIVFRVDDLELLRQLFENTKIAFSRKMLGKMLISISAKDPEGHLIVFDSTLFNPLPQSLPQQKLLEAVGASTPRRLIHAGFVVKDRARMDKFYRDVLGFRLYWEGGTKDGETDWVDMQVPDGTDWIEYMLNVPDNADKHLLGVMNHIALGVSDIHAADNRLMESALKMDINEAPKIGRDGKWQLDLYDPDGTRVELMEFTPVEKPCCSEYTGPHPQP